MFAASKTASVSGGYQISRSLRFNSADSAYLNRTPASAGNRKAWTMSFWVKRCNIVNRQILLEQFLSASDTGYSAIEFASDAAAPTLVVGGYNTTWRVTTQVFRDVSAWYHIVVAVDTTQATANNRVRVYVNGSEITSFSTLNNPTQNADTGANSTGPAGIGSATSGGSYLNGYMTEIYMVDGTQLTPSSFGNTDAQTGVWGPKAYSGSFGTNGFYLNFSDNSNTTAATLGKDYSGNGNNWTPNNFSVTAGAGNDSLVDVPTNFGVDTGVGGTVRGNYATCNPLLGSTATLSNGNLDIVVGTTATKMLATIGMSSGKWYWEYSYTNLTGDGISGIATAQASITAHVGLDAFSWGYVAGTGNKATNSASTAYGASYTTGDVIGVAFDADAGTLVFYKNGTSQGTAYSSLTSGPYFPAFGDNAASSSSSLNTNFGQRPFAYTAPSGFKALCTQNLPTPTIGATTATQAGKFFNPVIWTGDGTSGRTVTGVGFQPDWAWIKQRSGTNWHIFSDANRGFNKQLFSNSTDAETTNATAYIQSVNSDGYALGSDANVNGSGSTYVAWNWKANGSGSTNTAGSITSTVSASTTSGFSVVTYTGTGSAATVGHGLGVVPQMMIIKQRSPNTSNWTVYHQAIGNTNSLQLNLTNAVYTSATVWNNTTPTSSVFTVNTDGGVNTSASTYVAYCFAEVAGYSKFGSYTGNGSTDGPFVFCGFRPAWVLVKRTDGADDWHLFDNRRDGFNAINDPLYPNAAFAEGSGFVYMDLVSNGFKCRNNSFINNNGVNYIFMALAEAPQKFALAR